MTSSALVRPAIAARFAAFVLERYPFAAAAAAQALRAAKAGDLADAASIGRARAQLPQALRRALPAPPPELPDTTPAVAAGDRWAAAVDELIAA